MSSGILSKAVDLDSIFDPYVSSMTKARLTGITLSSSDLNNRYAPLNYGSSAPVTGIYSENADLNTIFAAYGSSNTNTPLPIDGDTYVAHSNGVYNVNMLAQVEMEINADGTYDLLVTANSPGHTPSTSGTWLPSGATASEYEVQFVWAQNSQYKDGPVTVTNTATSYVSCSSNQNITMNAQVGQTSTSAKGSEGVVTINLKRISSGSVTTTTFYVDIESTGDG